MLKYVKQLTSDSSAENIINRGYLDVLEWVDTLWHHPKEDGHYLISDGKGNSNILFFKKRNIHDLIFMNGEMPYPYLYWYEDNVELTGDDIVELCTSRTRWFDDGPFYENNKYEYGESGYLSVLRNPPKFYLNLNLDGFIGPDISQNYPIHLEEVGAEKISLITFFERYDDLTQ